MLFLALILIQGTGDRTLEVFQFRLGGLGGAEIRLGGFESGLGWGGIQGLEVRFVWGTEDGILGDSIHESIKI